MFKNQTNYIELEAASTLISIAAVTVGTLTNSEDVKKYFPFHISKEQLAEVGSLLPSCMFQQPILYHQVYLYTLNYTLASCDG